MRQLFIILAVGVSLQAQTKVDLSTQSRNGSGGSGLIQFKLDNSAVGSPRATANFQSSSGLLYSLGDTGTQINIQIIIDQNIITTNNALQLGTPTFLKETSSSTSVYTWTTNPVFNTYPALASFQAGTYTWHVGTSCVGSGITGNINTIGAVAIKRPDGSNPTTADCAAGQNLQLTYDSSTPKLVITGGLNPGSGGGGLLTWNNVSFAAGWGNIGTGYQTTQYAVDAGNGNVYLRGAISPSTGSLVFTLPAGARPATLIQPLFSDGGGVILQLDVHTDGTVTVPNGLGGASFIIITGLNFSTQ